MIQAIVQQVLCRLKEPEGIPVGVSNRHIHLSAEHMEVLFGCGKSLTKKKDLSQVGEFAAEETVTLVGPKGAMTGVRVLGPLRKTTQVELSLTDSFSLGVKVPFRNSGDIKGSAGIVVVGPCGAITLQEGVICATRHIHMSGDDARRFGVQDGELKTIAFDGVRGGTMTHVLIRVQNHFRLELHIDTDEANAFGLKNGDKVTLL
ncbi:MAG: phosphate propanoyltransferase [Sporomusaceae bacterium]|nr:phosphate propanoyltransferase [Sporomusaceae bacterium]